MNKKTEAIEDCTKAIELDDKYVKAYLRRAKWYIMEPLFRMIQLSHCPLSSHVLFLLAYATQRSLLSCSTLNTRVPTPEKSWIFISKISRTWKVIENEFGPGRSWKLKFNVV